MAVTALELGPNIALALFLSPPAIALDALTPNRSAAARHDNPPQSRQRHACEGQPIRIWPCTPAPLAGQKHESELTRFGNPLTIQSDGKML
jgi:hypothetical protein